MKFYILNELENFDMILGNDSLRNLKAIIDIANNTLIIKNKMRINIKQDYSEDVNNISLRTTHMNVKDEKNLKNICLNYKKLFSEPDEKLTYTTKVKAEIRTTTDRPVYSRYYPYPMSLKDVVEEEIKKMLDDGIIRPSRSPYNSPVWIVPKKMDASGKKKYRVVIDYRKLNQVTIADKYPIPEINEVISQLGKNKIFSVLDLKSGFHQIKLKNEDIEKTAFSINNAKYEFTRMPFGLKNAPSIFQRALDDILREHIGKRCFVYIDDIIIFSKNEEDHIKDIEEIFKTLQDANMKVQLDKSEFFKKEVEFLGFIVSDQGISTNPKKIEAIKNFPEPKTIKDIRSFLGLSGYYRRFIRDYAKLAKPLTSLLRGEGGHTSKSTSNKTPINFNEDAKSAFKKIKNTLISEDIILTYPDFNKEFHLTTDASKYALGAVLEQEGKPITFISRTLSKTEENYATNEREMLAIIWALKALRNYLYGTAKVVIFTDHQPLTFTLNSKNCNGKMKRWKCFLEEYNYEIKYKPGKSNVVADTLSRPPQSINLTSTQHSHESSSENLIPATEAPINVFKNQIFILKENEDSYQFLIPFPTIHRHIIKKPDFQEHDLINILKQRLNPSIINGLYTSEEIMGKIQEIYPIHFSNYKIRFTQTKVEDIQSETEQEEKILTEHRRAHRNSRENREQIIRRYYFPRMHSRIKSLIKNCKICKEEKYDRRPIKVKIQETPIPKYPGEIVHIDLYSTEGHVILTAIDKFSKYVQVKEIKSKTVEDIKSPLEELMYAFGLPKLVVFDNEKSFNSVVINHMLKDEMNIDIYVTPPYTSTANGQIERFHSTLTEIMRCLDAEHVDEDYTFEELLRKAVNEYNCSIHSTIKQKPIEVFFGKRVTTDHNQIEEERKINEERLKLKQCEDLEFHNKKRNIGKNYQPGDVIFVKINKRLGTKLTPRYRKEIVAENFRTTIKTTTGKIIHKNNIKN